MKSSYKLPELKPPAIKYYTMLIGTSLNEQQLTNDVFDCSSVIILLDPRVSWTTTIMLLLNVHKICLTIVPSNLLNEIKYVGYCNKKYAKDSHRK